MEPRARQAPSPIEAFLDWFERHKYGVIGTLALHTMLLFTLAITSMQDDVLDDEPAELQLEITTLVPDEDLQLVQDAMLAEQRPSAPNDVQNLVSNITASSTRLSAVAQQRIQEAVEQDLRSLEQAEFDRLAQERSARGEDIVMPQLDPTKWDKALYMEKAAEPAKVEGNAIAWHDLKDRSERRLHIPGYMSKDQGQVAVRVTVDRDGSVRKAELDRDHTTTTNEEMHELALASARNALFNASATAPDPQRGTIYYLFLAQ